MARPSIKDFKKATKICQKFNIKAYFAYTGEASEADVHERKIYIDLNETINLDWFWSLIFHEIAHVWCLDNKKYMYYHDCMNEDTKEFSLYVRKYGLKIERYVDKIGKKLGKESGIRFKYKPAYRSKKDIEWYHNWIEENFPL